MRRCATAASSTKPCLASHLRVWMISLRRSGQRALFVRPHERHIGHAAPSTLRREKDQIKKLRAYYPTARLVPNIDVRGGIVHASRRSPVLGFKNCGVARSAVRWDNRNRDRLTENCGAKYRAPPRGMNN